MIRPFFPNFCKMMFWPKFFTFFKVLNKLQIAIALVDFITLLILETFLLKKNSFIHILHSSQILPFDLILTFLWICSKKCLHKCEKNWISSFTILHHSCGKTLFFGRPVEHVIVVTLLLYLIANHEKKFPSIIKIISRIGHISTPSKERWGKHINMSSG